MVTAGPFGREFGEVGRRGGGWGRHGLGRRYDHSQTIITRSQQSQRASSGSHSRGIGTPLASIRVGAAADASARLESTRELCPGPTDCIYI